jgi:hypothetical protein
MTFSNFLQFLELPSTEGQFINTAARMIEVADQGLQSNPGMESFAAKGLLANVHSLRNNWQAINYEGPNGQIETDGFVLMGENREFIPGVKHLYSQSLNHLDILQKLMYLRTLPSG